MLRLVPSISNQVVVSQLGAFIIKTSALGLLISLSLFCHAQQTSHLCQIALGPLAGMLEHAESPGVIGSSCSDVAGNRGFYVSVPQLQQEQQERPCYACSTAQPALAPPLVPKRPKPYQDDTISPLPPSTQSTEAPPIPTKNYARPTAPFDMSAQKPAPPTTAAQTAQSLAQQVHLWFEDLPEGSVKYHVPSNMVLNEPYSATAVLHPPEKAKASGSDGKPLKVSTYMRIILAKPDNPDTFDIQPEQGSCKFIPIDADTTWTFVVKPLLPGDNKHLSFSAYAVYGVDDSSCAPENLKLVNVLSETETVTIAAITRQRAWQQIVVSFLSDPIKWFKFILPGGTGFVVIGGLVRWWHKRRNSKPQ